MNLDFLKTPEFADARAAFVSKYEDQGRSDCTCVGFFDEDNGFVPDSNPQCHIGLSRPGSSEDGGYYDEDDEWVEVDELTVEKPLVIFSGFQEYDEDDSDKADIFEFWFNYQKNHPIIGKAVLNEDWEDAYNKGWMFHTDLHYNVLSCSIFFTRWPSEFAPACRAMKLLVEAGCQPDMAFLASTVVSADSEGNLFERILNSHMPCQSHLKDDFPKNFLSHKVVSKPGKTYREHPTYDSIDGVFCTNRGYVYGGMKDITGDGAKIVRALRSGSSSDWVQGADIFYTRAQHEKELARRGHGLLIKPNTLPAVAKALNAVREEILNG